jgi:hypothetical protein
VRGVKWKWSTVEGVLGAALVSSLMWTLLTLTMNACQKEPTAKETNGGELSKPATPQVIGQAHYQPGPDPLAALYGKGKAKNGEAGFKNLAHHPLSAPMPSVWRRAYKTLSERAGVSVKLSAWSALERSRLDQKQADFDVRWTLELLGERAQLKRALKALMGSFASFKSLAPPQWGDGLEHTGRSGALSLSVNSEERWREGERAHLRVELRWAREAPAPGRGADLRNCRYSKGLTPPSSAEAPAWLSPIFKTNSKRRFVEWSYQRGDEEAPRWSALWVYRNGSLRDKGVRWWTEALSAHGGSQQSMRGMAQTWRLKQDEGSKAEVSWWSESDPSELGCLLEAPLLGVSWRELK